MKPLVLFLLLLTASFVKLPADSYLLDPANTRLNLGYTFGKFIAIEDNYGEAELFVPVVGNKCWQLFIDASVYRFHNREHVKNNRWAGSSGIGIRSHISSTSVLGFNAFYDFRQGRCKHDFNQVGLGVEWLNPCWDIRFNGYLPTGRRSFVNSITRFDFDSSGFTAIRRNLEYAYTGFDAELGIPFFRTKEFNLYGAAGPYYYTRKHRNSFCGGFARVELDWRSIVSLEARYSYDRIHHSCFQGIVELSLPFGILCDPCNICRSLLNRPIQRNGIIQIDHCCDWNWNWND